LGREEALIVAESLKKKRSDAEIDAAFAEMAHDDEYLSEAIALAREFEVSDWEAYCLLDPRKTPTDDYARLPLL